MRRAIAVVWAMGAAAVAVPAQAADQAGKLELGLRLGAAFPLGDVAKGVALSDSLSVGIPVQLELGYRFTPELAAGVYGQYGYVVAKNCPSGSTCSASDWRAGIQGSFRFVNVTSFTPWLGLGIGYEWNEFKQSGVGSATAEGWEFLNLQGGADWSLSPAFTLGPYLLFTLAEYNDFGGSIPSDAQALHEWLVLGVKGTFSL